MRDRFRRFERQAMAGARHDHALCARERAGKPCGDRDIALVALAGEHDRGHRERVEAIPQRRETPGTEGAERRRKLRGSKATRVGSNLLVDPCRIAREQRTGAPALDELLDRALLDLAGELLVGGEPLGLVVDAGGRRDEDEARHALGCRGRDLKRHASAHRVATQDEAIGRSVCDPAQGIGAEVERER